MQLSWEFDESETFSSLYNSQDLFSNFMVVEVLKICKHPRVSVGRRCRDGKNYKQGIRGDEAGIG